MKKNLEKIFASASIVVAIILIMILLVTAFGGIDFDEFQSELVRGLLITLGILYLVLAGFALVLMFIRTDVVKEVVVKSEKGGAVKVSVKVVKNFVKQACGQIEGVKFKKVTLVQDDYGVRLKVNIKVMDENTTRVEAYLRALIEEIFYSEFGFKFISIETKVMVVTPKNQEELDSLKAISDQKAEEALAQAEENAEEEEIVEEEVVEETEAAEEEE